MISIRLQGNERWSSGSVETKFQFLEDVRTQSSARLHRVSGEAVTEGFCHHRSTYDGTSFQNQNFFALFGEIRGSDQAIVSCTDDEGVVVTHNAPSFKISFAASMPAAPITPPPGCAPLAPK